jgi:hypothetical protein
MDMEHSELVSEILHRKITNNNNNNNNNKNNNRQVKCIIIKV